MKKEISFKVITIGDAGVGKTSIIRRFIYNTFNTNAMSTIGVSFSVKEITLKNGVKVSIKLIDTAGQEKYRSLSKSYFKNTDGVLFVFDLNNLDSFKNISEWVELYKQNDCGKGIPIYLIGNKSDLEIKVEQKLIDDFTKEQNFKYEAVSALSNLNIELLFQDLAENIYKDYKISEQKTMQLKVSDSPKKKKKCALCEFNEDL